MESNKQETTLKCIDHNKECTQFCVNEKCMYPLLCIECLDEHQKEYSMFNNHELKPIEELFDEEEKRLEFIEEYNKDMDTIEKETQEKKEILKGAYNEFTHEVLKSCHRYFINNNIDNVVENLKNEFEFSKAEYQNQMTPETLKKMAEDYLKLQKVSQVLKEKPDFLLSKEQLFENIENELENLNTMVQSQLNRLKTNYKEQLKNVVDYDIEKHFDRLVEEEINKQNNLQNIQQYNNQIEEEED